MKHSLQVYWVGKTGRFVHKCLSEFAFKKTHPVCPYINDSVGRFFLPLETFFDSVSSSDNPGIDLLLPLLSLLLLLLLLLLLVWSHDGVVEHDWSRSPTTSAPWRSPRDEPGDANLNPMKRKVLISRFIEEVTSVAARSRRKKRYVINILNASYWIS